MATHRWKALGALVFVGLASLFVGTRAIHAQTKGKWESAMASFLREDEATPFPSGGIVFVGSSSIRLWDLKKSFPGREMLNRGFGGSQAEDAVENLDLLVMKHRPRRVVFYSGDNDLAHGKTPRTVADDYERFVDNIQTKLPTCEILILSIKPSSSRWNLKSKQDEANKLIEEMAKEREGVEYLDVGSLLLKEDVRPNDDLFLADRLHLNEKGYTLWSKAVERWLARDKVDSSK